MNNEKSAADRSPQLLNASLHFPENSGRIQGNSGKKQVARSKKQERKAKIFLLHS
jgi:hypothetical protein